MDKTKYRVLYHECGWKFRGRFVGSNPPWDGGYVVVDGQDDDGSPRCLKCHYVIVGDDCLTEKEWLESVEATGVRT